MTGARLRRRDGSAYLMAYRPIAGMAIAAILLQAAPAAAQRGAGFGGDWLLMLTDRGSRHTGVLQIDASGGTMTAYVDGGPVTIDVDGDRIAMEIDTRDGGGRLLAYSLRGQLDDGRLSGELQPPLDAPAGSWQADRIVAVEPQAPRPVDFSGIWSRTSSGIAKVHLDYTAAARAAVDDYSYLDDPALRCVSPGLVRVSGWPYPLEIVQTEDRVTILYESFHEVRRIDLDGRGFPDDLPPRSMGYSVGHWDGSTLVVETRRLSAGFVDLHGQPLSEQARVVERMSLSDDRQSMRSELTLYDPVNYNRPITRHRSWRRTPDTVILEYDCDPYPFFRGLELEGRLQEYFDRMRRR